MCNLLRKIDWDADSYEVTDDVQIDLRSNATLDRDKIILECVSAFEQNVSHEHYVYCIKYEHNGDTRWYVGETANLADRITTHSRNKNIQNVERVEGVDSREEAREREHDLHAEVILDKQSTDVWGGH
jgi:predicted GIY-YIG superfamily endonuclease